MLEMLSVLVGVTSLLLLSSYYRQKWRKELGVAPRGRGYIYFFRGKYESPTFIKAWGSATSAAIFTSAGAGLMFGWSLSKTARPSRQPSIST